MQVFCRLHLKMSPINDTIDQMDELELPDIRSAIANGAKSF